MLLGIPGNVYRPLDSFYFFFFLTIALLYTKMLEWLGVVIVQYKDLASMHTTLVDTCEKCYSRSLQSYDLDLYKICITTACNNIARFHSI